MRVIQQVCLDPENQLNCQASAEKVWYPGRKVEVVGVKLIAMGAGDADTACNVTVNVANASGGSSAQQFLLEIPANTAVDAAFYDEDAATSTLTVEPGQRLEITVSATATNALNVVPVIEFVDIPTSDALLTNGVAVG